MIRLTWAFADTIRQERQERLLRISDFDEVIAAVTTSADVIAFAIEPGSSENLKGCVRVELRLELPLEACDAFFNAPVGYRGQYVIHPEQGTRENHRLLKELIPKLERALDQYPQNTNLMALAMASLNAEDAKVWIIDSAGKEFLNSEKLTIHILHPPWVDHARAAFEGTGDVAEDAALSKAIRGVLAPESRFLDVKGGWIEKISHVERLNPFKAERALDIQRYGWA